MNKSFIKRFSYSEVVKKSFIEQRQRPSKKREAISMLVQQLVPQKLESFFEIQKDIGTFNPYAPPYILGFKLERLIRMIKLTNKKEQQLLQSELVLLDNAEFFAEKLKRVQRTGQINLKVKELIEIRKNLVKAIIDRLNDIQTLILKENLEGLEESYGNFINKVLFIIESFKTIIKINEANLGNLENIKNIRKRINYGDDKLAFVALKYYAFMLLLIQFNEEKLENFHAPIDKFIKYELRSILTKSDLLNFKTNTRA